MPRPTLTSTYTYQVGVGDYTSDISIDPTFTEAHVLRRNQCSYPDRKEIRVKCLQQRGDSLLHLQTYKSLASQVLLKRSEKAESLGARSMPYTERSAFFQP